MQAWLHPFHDDAGAIAKRGWRCCAGQPQREEQADAVRPAEVEVLPNDGFEELASLDGPVKDVGEADFELIDRHAMVVAGPAVLSGQRPRKAMGPAVKEALDIGRAERIARGLEHHGIRTREEGWREK